MRLRLGALLLVCLLGCHPQDVPLTTDVLIGRVVARYWHDWEHGRSYYLRIAHGEGSTHLIVVSLDDWRTCRAYPEFPSMWDRDHCE